MLNIASLSREEREELLTLVEEKFKRAERSKITHFEPRPKQLEFYAAGATYSERLFTAGNQQGKTFGAGAEVSYHLTGQYPDWWPGYRFLKPIICWGASNSMELSRDGMQAVLLGPHGNRGTGLIPPHLIIAIMAARGVAGASSVTRIRHVSGGMSQIVFKSYDQGRLKFQAGTVDLVWNDEEPPEDVYSEIITRTNATGGLVMTTFTPLLGVTKVVKKFMPTPDAPHRHCTRMTIDDIPGMTEEQKEFLLSKYPEHERDARLRGLPMQGEGVVFPIARSQVEYTPFPIPAHWPRIAAIDFGWDHPTAVAWLAWDRDTDTLYVYDCYARSKEVPAIHASAMRSRGTWIPTMWPHDGLQHDKGSGEQLADQYRKEGIKMHPDRVTFEDGSNGVEAGVMEMLTRMRQGRLKIARHLEEVWQEFGMYHRKDGLIVKEADDRLCAIRYAMMGRRYAQTEPTGEAMDFSYETDY